MADLNKEEMSKYSSKILYLLNKKIRHKIR